VNETITIPERPLKRPTLVGEELEGMDEIVFVDTENDTSVSLNIIGATILELCDGEHTEAAIAELIMESLPGDTAQVRKDIHHILEEFAAYGLFVVE